MGDEDSKLVEFFRKVGEGVSLGKRDLGLAFDHPEHPWRE